MHVQRDLLSRDIDSAPMTTDTGIDLLAYDQKSRKSFSIQVKTKTSGEKGLSKTRPDWKVGRDKLQDADVFAFVLKHKDRDGEAWYFPQSKLVAPYVRLYNREWALTFYRKDGLKRPLKKGRLTDSDLDEFKGKKGLDQVLRALAVGRIRTRRSSH